MPNPTQPLPRIRKSVKFLKDRLPDRTSLLERKWARPFAAWLSHQGLWHFNRRSVARGVSLGLFFGLLLPVGQILLVAVTAIGARANIPAAVGATFITNPLTYPPIYFGATQAGRWVLGEGPTSAEAAGSPDGGRLVALLDWIGTVGPALGVGLALFAMTGAAVGYLAVHVAWRLAVLRRRRRRV